MGFAVIDGDNTGLAAVGTSPTILFTAPATADRIYILTELTVSNLLGSNIAFTITLTDDSETSEVRNWYKDIPLSNGASEEFDIRRILAPDDIITATCDTAVGMDVNMSYVIVDTS